MKFISNYDNEPTINFPVSNRLLKDGIIDATSLTTPTVGFDEAKETTKPVIEGSEPIIKDVLHPYN